MDKNLCNLCPRECNIDRFIQNGFCGVLGKGIYGAKAALHFWEEPCISGKGGSGTVFFSGCTLRCVYCQNYNIANAKRGRMITAVRLAEIFIELQKKGAENINLVTPTHYTPEIIKAVKAARNNGLNIPVVYNCSGYEKVDTLKTLEDIVDIYLTDFKYMDCSIAKKYSNAEDYPFIAKKALDEMVRQQGNPQFDEKGLMQKGVIVRHLILPGYIKNAENVIKYVYKKYGNNAFISLMNQYTPIKQVAKYPEINRKVTRREYTHIINFALSLGIENAFIQEGETAEESFIPDFDFEGWS